MTEFSLRLRVGILIILSLVFSVDDLWGAGGGGGATGETFWQIVSFILLLILLANVLKKPIRSLLSKRREEVKNSLEQAAHLEEESRAHFAEWERKLNLLSQEVADLHQKISQEGEAERRRIVERAQEEGDRMKKQAQVAAEQEVKKARAALKKEMVDLSVELAEKLLQDVMKPQDQERLVRDYIGKVKELR